MEQNNNTHVPKHTPKPEPDASKMIAVRDHILDAVKAGQVKMRPRWHFILQSILTVLGLVIGILAVMYLVSFAVFVLRQTGVLFVPSFGYRGYFVFLRSMPWLLILLAIFFVAILEILTRRYSFAYRRPLLYTIIGIVAFTFIGGALVGLTSFHGRLSHYAEQQEVPVASELYELFRGEQVVNVHRGTVTALFPQGFAMQNARSENLMVLVTPDTSFPTGNVFRVGDLVVVFGNRVGSIIHALGVRVINGETDSN